MDQDNCCGGGCCETGAETEALMPFGGPVRIGETIPNLEFDYYQKEAFHRGHMSDYKGKWVIVFFYPADFTFICPTELEEMAEHYAEFQKLGAEILGVSRDTKFVHKAWHDHSAAIKKIEYPMVADPTGEISETFGVAIDDGEDAGLSLRGTFIVNPDGELVAYEVHANNIGRSAKEVLRKLEAAVFVREHNGQEVCPAGWTKGGKTLKPGIDLVGKI